MMNPMMNTPDADSASTLNPEEVARFQRMAERWWDPDGPMRPLHIINPLRLDYICQQWRDSGAAEPGQGQGQQVAENQPLAAVRALDMGCGGGLLSEGLSGLGAQVVGLDASAEMIATAQARAAQRGGEVSYRCGSSEQLLPQEAGQYDLLCCLEVIEHAANPSLLVRHCAELVRPGGLLVFSTINRNPLAFATAIVGAEYILRLLPKGTHSYRMLVRPSELAAWGRAAGLQLLDLTGMRYNPFSHSCRLSSDTAVNYLMTLRRPAQ